ncbi:MAG: NADH-quinone oxidoreductase subunit C [Acidobacteria bacterium]|nr:NADH-quinone oxidoreductase subunit C [Acidobacteriota bacterium]
MAAEPWDDDLTRALAQQFGNRVERYATYLGQKFLVAEMAAVRDIIEFLKLEAEFDYLVDLTAVDYPNRPKRFEVVYILYSFARNERVRIKCSVAESERPLSVACVHATADWMEREVFDMFGIEFAEHPDLKRLLMPDDWQGFPLRRDVSILAMDNRWVKENLGIESGQ